MDAPDAPALTETALSNGLPAVEVLFSSLDGDAETITVWRIADGVREVVRGMDRARVAGDFFGVDYEVPFGVQSTYVGEIFDGGGASITGSQSLIQVDADAVWFQDQTDPENSLSFPMNSYTADGLRSSTFESIQRVRRTAKQFVFGKHRPFLQNFGLGAIEGLPIDVTVQSSEMFQALKRLMQSSPVLVRTPPAFEALPRLLSANVNMPSTFTHFPGAPQEWHVWALTVDEVEPVAKAIIRPLVTWSDWEEAFPEADYTWTDVVLLYSAGTWTDAMRNPPHA